MMIRQARGAKDDFFSVERQQIFVLAIRNEGKWGSKCVNFRNKQKAKLKNTKKNMKIVHFTGINFNFVKIFFSDFEIFDGKMRSGKRIWNPSKPQIDHHHDVAAIRLIRIMKTEKLTNDDDDDVKKAIRVAQHESSFSHIQSLGTSWDGPWTSNSDDNKNRKLINFSLALKSFNDSRTNKSVREKKKVEFISALQVGSSHFYVFIFVCDLTLILFLFALHIFLWFFLPIFVYLQCSMWLY